MRMISNFSKKRHCRTEKEQLRERSGAGKIKMMKSLHVSSSINLIGKTVDEAIALLDKYLDDAYLAKLHQITIIHGVGTGALRNAVQAHLKKVNTSKPIVWENTVRAATV